MNIIPSFFIENQIMYPGTSITCHQFIHTHIISLTNTSPFQVRRLDALPEYDETTPSRTVVALNLPIERPTIEAVAELFSVCGEIVLVRILRPGNPIPADVKPFANKHPEMTDKVCALVEYEKTEFAHKAVKDLNKEGEEGMKVSQVLMFENLFSVL